MDVDIDWDTTSNKAADNVDGDILQETASQNFRYEKEPTKILKHRKDVCSTTVASKRSEKVKGLSLDDVISQRKILTPKKRDVSRKHVDVDQTTSEDVNLGLDEIIQKRAVSKAKVPDLEKSLEEIIRLRTQSRKAEDFDSSVLPEHGFKDKEKEKFMSLNEEGGRKRKMVVDRDDDSDDSVYYASPMDVIHRLSEDGLIIEQEIGKLKERTQGREHTWRATFTCGSAKTVVDSCRKVLAKEAAACEFLKLLKANNICVKMPVFKIPEACFYDGAVCDRLEEVTKNMGLGVPRFETVQTVKCHRDYYITTYFIDTDEFIGEAFNVDHSKILAAKPAYETYSGKKLPRDTYIVGKGHELGGIEPDEFKCIETEATHILNLNSIPALNHNILNLAEAEDEEVLVDDEGGVFVKVKDGSNKIRRLTRAGLNELLRCKLLEVSKEDNATMMRDELEPEIDSESEEELQ